MTGSTSQYRYSNIDSLWLSAEQVCEMDTLGITRHTHLAVIGNETERTGLFAKLKTAGLTQNVWIGLSDIKTEGTFRWVTAQAVPVPANGQSPPWAPGQPDNNTGNADCVRLISPGDPNEGRYDDVECNAAAGFEFVCECDDFPAVPANYM